jgi:colanic acid/amylovoran biosynthesis glycosyltransferase
MAHGIPVISTLTGGLPELLSGDAGIMVPPTRWSVC